MLKVDHLEHLESLVFYGEHSAKQALDIVKNIDTQNITVKYDGSPAILFGWDEKDRFFLATKSIFNKTPKRNYSHEDIDINHGSNPGLVDKLKKIFYPLKSACEFQLALLNELFVVQGDLMFTEDDLWFDGDAWRCKENVLEYSFGGLNIPNYKMGIALHTVYQYVNNELVMRPDISIENFRHIGKPSAPIMIFMDKAFIDINTWHEDYCHKITKFMDQIIEWNSVTTFEALQAVNSVIRAGNPITVNNVTKAMPPYVDPKLIQLHQMFHTIKNSMIYRMRQSNFPNISVYLNGQLGDHEGYVVSLPTGQKIKLVNREVFSAANFARWE